MSHEQAVEEFVAITSGSAEDAHFYLGQTHGDLEDAVDMFLNKGPVPSEPAPVKATGPPSSRPATGKIRGLGDLANSTEENEDSDYNDYYTGGEKSGMVVRGAPKDKKSDVEDIFEGARRSGARDGRPEDLAQNVSKMFSGRARTLGGAEASSSEVSRDAPDAPRTFTITFYANGIFTINDGEPRSMTDPANMPFMQSIMRGECPAELDPGTSDVPIHVNLVRSHEEYAEPEKPKYKAFSGSGRRLVDDSAPPSQAAAAAASEGLPATWEGANPSLPRTTIQLRLADGSRMLAEFNLTQTVGDIRKFIHAARPGGPIAYHLATAFPSANLQDDSATIEGAGLANSVVIQKL